MSTLEHFGITPRRATGDQLHQALISVQVGIADPTVKTLLCHIAAMTEERNQIAEERDLLAEERDLLARRLEAANR